MSNNQDNGDAAAIRGALTKVSEWMAHRIATGGFEASPTIPTVLEDVVLPALAKPQRNFDRFNDYAEAKDYFVKHELWKYNENLSPEYWFGEWLFEQVTQEN